MFVGTGGFGFYFGSSWSLSLWSLCRYVYVGFGYVVYVLYFIGVEFDYVLVFMCVVSIML